MPIRPITLIYGPNSSGKSSILPSLLLLKQTLEEADASTALLPKGSLVDFGSYREFVHRHETRKEFSFKACWGLEVEKIEIKWVRELLQVTKLPLVGLKISFWYDEEKAQPTLSCIKIFGNDQDVPLLSYFPYRLSDRKFLALTEINLLHNFWRIWWTDLRESIEAALDDEVEWVAYKDYKNDEFPLDFGVEDLRRDLQNYPFEKALHDLRWENSHLSLESLQFLPVDIASMSIEILTEFVDKFKHRSSSERADEFYKELSRSIAEFADKESASAEKELSPFEAMIFYHSTSQREPFRQGLKVTPIALSICTAFRYLLNEMVYLGPLRGYPERYYTFSGNLSEQVGKQGERLPDILFQNPEILKRVNVEFDRFGLGYELRLAVLKDEDSNLSNVFALRVVDKETGVNASIRDVGFGVSQVLPILVQSLLSQNKTLLIEQPEIHLHPALQAELGDLFIKSVLGEQKNTFILETHSEHLMLRILRRIRETTDGELPPGLTPIRPEDVAVLYVQPGTDGSKVIEIPIRSDGEFAEQWPQGFFAERAKELF